MCFIKANSDIINIYNIQLTSDSVSLVCKWKAIIIDSVDSKYNMKKKTIE